MSSIINIPGRLHSFETGNIVTVASEIYDERLAAKQSDINSSIVRHIFMTSEQYEELDGNYIQDALYFIVGGSGIPDNPDNPVNPTTDSPEVIGDTLYNIHGTVVGDTLTITESSILGFVTEDGPIPISENTSNSSEVNDDALSVYGELNDDVMAVSGQYENDTLIIQ